MAGLQRFSQHILWSEKQATLHCIRIPLHTDMVGSSPQAPLQKNLIEDEIDFKGQFFCHPYMKGSHDWEKDEDALDPDCFAFRFLIFKERSPMARSGFYWPPSRLQSRRQSWRLNKIDNKLYKWLDWSLSFLPLMLRWTCQESLRQITALLFELCAICC